MWEVSRPIFYTKRIIIFWCKCLVLQGACHEAKCSCGVVVVSGGVGSIRTAVVGVVNKRWEGGWHWVGYHCARLHQYGVDNTPRCRAMGLDLWVRLQATTCG